MGKLDGKIAIVTGAGKGLGRAEALALAKEGAAVSLVDLILEDAEKVADEITELGGRTISLQCDVSVRDQVIDAVEATVKEFGTVDILVNNAQYMGFKRSPVEDWTEKDMQLCWNTGAMGSWYFMVACFPYMKKNGGKIINTSSASGYASYYKVQTLGYGMAKEAIRTLTRDAAQEWGEYNINVNVICPSAVTPSTKFQFSDDPNSDKAPRPAVGPALGRKGDPEKDIAPPVVFLAGPDSDYITGCSLNVDGGAAFIV